MASLKDQARPTPENCLILQNFYRTTSAREAYLAFRPLPWTLSPWTISKFHICSCIRLRLPEVLKRRTFLLPPLSNPPWPPTMLYELSLSFCTRRSLEPNSYRGIALLTGVSISKSLSILHDAPPSRTIRNLPTNEAAHCPCSAQHIPPPPPSEPKHSCLFHAVGDEIGGPTHKCCQYIKLWRSRRHSWHYWA